MTEPLALGPGWGPYGFGLLTGLGPETGVPNPAFVLQPVTTNKRAMPIAGFERKYFSKCIAQGFAGVSGPALVAY